MSEPKRVGDLEIGQDLSFQKLQWRIERIGWAVMAAMLLAAVLGLLGPGPLSSARAGEAGSALWCEYNRLERYDSSNRMLVHIGPDAARGSMTRLALNREFIEGIELRHIDPEPEKIEVTADRFVYVFNTPDPAQMATVAFHFEPNTYGKIPVRVGLDGADELHFWQFYYP